jgi:hypothetical protein
LRNRKTNDESKTTRVDSLNTANHQPATFTYQELKVKYYDPCYPKDFSLRHPPYDLSASVTHELAKSIESISSPFETT